MVFSNRVASAQSTERRYCDIATITIERIVLEMPTGLKTFSQSFGIFVGVKHAAKITENNHMREGTVQLRARIRCAGSKK